MNLENLLHDTKAIVNLTAGFIRDAAAQVGHIEVEEKGLHDLVSYVDRQAEQQLISGLQALLPGSGVLAEESGSAQGGRYNWVIDPLDGTTNFLHGVPLYAISVALKEDDAIILGVVHELGRDECFYSHKGGACYMNGREISVSSRQELNQSLLATGFPYHDFSRMQPYLKLFDQLMRRSRGIRRLGSAAADLAYVACGRFDAFYEYGLHPWDIAAGVFLVQQAGGKVTTFQGKEDVLFGPDILATNGHLHTSLTQEINIAFA